MKKTILFICTLVVLFIISSCSNGMAPVTPQDLSSEDYKLDTRGVFGVWKVHVDVDNRTAEILPSRNAKAIGDIFDADLSQFLTVSPCSNCLQIPRIQLDAFDDLVIDISIRHPFANLSARPDLHGFDTRAIIIMETDPMASYPEIDITMPDGSTEDAVLASMYGGIINADGYTSHYDELVLDDRYFITGTDQAGNLNPFFRFFEDPTTGVFDPLAPSGYNVMPTGSGVQTRSAVFDIDLDSGGAAFSFYIVADVAYGHSATYLNRDNPEYYLPWFNRTEAWRVEYWIENNVLTNDIASTADVVVQIFDWQQGAAIDTEYPDPANPGGIPQASDVVEVELSIPYYQPDLLTGTYESGTGAPDSPLQYRFTITNINEERYDAYGLLAIRDTLDGQAYPDGRMGVPVNPAGFPYETLDIRDYTLYQYVHVNNPYDHRVPSDEQEFTDNEIFLKDVSQFAYENGGTSDTTMIATHHMDPGHTMFTYDWDYNYNGTTFDVDGTGMPSPVIPYANPGHHDVGCRVTTNSVPPQEYTYTFPVVAEGEIFNKEIQTPGTREYATSMMRGRSAYVYEDGFYLTYIRKDSSQIDIYLAVGDKNGNITHHRITDSADQSFSPSLAVIEDGPEAGVYITYVTSAGGSIRYIYSIHGNLDGTGFDPANIERVSTAGDVMELYPNLFYFRGNLHLYYMNYNNSTFSGYIYAAHSEDGADTWIEDVWIVDNGSTSQNMPSAIMSRSSGGIYLVWSDNLDFITRGSDLWCSVSSDGTSFFEPHNISTLRGDINESNAEVDYNKSNLFIAYVTGDTSLPGTSIYLKVLELSNYNSVDYLVDESNSPGEMHSHPSITVNGDNQIYIAFSQNLTDYDELIYTVVDMRPTGLMHFYHTYLISSDPVTALTNQATQVNPVLASNLPVKYGMDCFVAWTNYSNGYTEYFGLNFGNIAVSEHITNSGNDD